jgi:hypothetical protein
MYVACERHEALSLHTILTATRGVLVDAFMNGFRSDFSGADYDSARDFI